MPTERLTMRKIREILRLKWEEGLSGRKIAQSIKASPSTVSDYLNRAKLAGLSWPLPESLEDDGELEALLFPSTPAATERAQPEYQNIYMELKRKGVTLTLLWLEYREQHQESGYQYSQFCELYREWSSQLEPVMRQSHAGGEKLFVDYAGQTVPLFNEETGEEKECVVFVATLGASNYTYVEVQESQSLHNWIAGHIRAFEFFGGAAKVLVPDNLKAGVKSPCFYEPEINPTYQELAEHYGCVVIPARVRKPKDKAKVENGVLQVERWVLAPLREEKVFSLAEWNEKIAPQRDWLNNRPLSRLEGTRRTLFEQLDKPNLVELPEHRYVLTQWKVKVKVNADYHVTFEGHSYSVPHQLIGKQVDIRATQQTLELWHQNRRVAAHLRSSDMGRFTTDPTHRPPHHQAYLDWTFEKLMQHAQSIGEQTKTLIQVVMENRKHSEQGTRIALGILRLAKTYGNERLEKACKRAIHFGLHSYRSVESILKNRLEQQTDETEEKEASLLEHENIRGPQYYK